MRKAETSSRTSTVLGWIIGAVIGAAFCLVAWMPITEKFSGGNTVLAAFLLLCMTPIAVLTSVVGGWVTASRVLPYFSRSPNSADDQKKRRRQLLGLLLSVAVAFAAPVWITVELGKPPSDTAMLRHFDSQEHTFDNLVRMAREDGRLRRVDDDWTDPDAVTIGISKARVEAYRKLLRVAATPRGYRASSVCCEYQFYFWVRGSAISNSKSKGFAYRESPPSNVVQTLDGMDFGFREYSMSYRHIRGNWYLFYEFAPG